MERGALERIRPVRFHSGAGLDRPRAPSSHPSRPRRPMDSADRVVSTPIHRLRIRFPGWRCRRPMAGGACVRRASRWCLPSSPGSRWPSRATPAAPSIMPSCCGHFRSFLSRSCWRHFPGAGWRSGSPFADRHESAGGERIHSRIRRQRRIGNFTDACFPLSDAIPENGHPVYVVDWGMANTIAMFHKGRSRFARSTVCSSPPLPLKTSATSSRWSFADPDALFVGHVPGHEVMQTRANLDRAAASFHRRKQMIRIVTDSNGRPVFEIFRWVPEDRI